MLGNSMWLNESDSRMNNIHSIMLNYRYGFTTVSLACAAQAFKDVKALKSEVLCACDIPSHHLC